MTEDEENKLLAFAFKQDASAIRCADFLIKSSQTLDDLYDRDKPVSSLQCVNMVLNLSVDMVREPFYQKHQSSMVFIIERAIMQWMEANTIEGDKLASNASLLAAYIIRSSITDALIKMVYLLGDRQHGLTVARQLREAVYSDNEEFAEYLRERDEKILGV